MTAAKLEWVVQRTDEAVPRYLGSWRNYFVWVSDPVNALHFLSQDHAETMGNQMSLPCKAVKSGDELNETTEHPSP